MSNEKSEHINESPKNRFWSTKISGISLPIYLVIVLILIGTMALGKLPKGILGPLAVLVIFGNLFHFLGTKIPIIKTYLGGGSVFAIFASAALATFGILPHAVLQDTSNFINHMGFLDFYIAALITGSILGMNRDTLIKASVRFIPVALLSMIASFFAVGVVGMLIGNGFGKSVLYISLPAMAGGVGAGAVPLSSIYAHVLGTDASQIISRLIPATAMTNVLAIIGAALVARAGESKPGLSGQGKLVKTGSLGEAAQKELTLTIPQFGVGLMVSMSFFMLGQMANYFAPKVHAYAFMIIIVVLCKVFNFLPQYYEESAVMFNQLVVKNLTAAVLAGIGMALLNLNVLVSALTWQFVVLCLVSVISISVAASLIGRLFGLYPVESAITAGFCNNSMGGTGNVAVLSASKRMELIAFAQMGNRLGGAIVLIISGFIMQLFS